MKKYNISDLLPHRPPMQLITAVESVDFDKQTLIARVDITKDDLMYDESIGGIPSWISLEYILICIFFNIVVPSLKTQSMIHLSDSGVPRIGFGPFPPGLLSVSEKNEFTFNALSKIFSVSLDISKACVPITAPKTKAKKTQAMRVIMIVSLILDAFIASVEVLICLRLIILLNFISYST